MNAFIKFTVVFCLLLQANMSLAQLKKANFHYDAYSFQKAIPKFERYLKKDPYHGEALFRLANAYRLTGEVKKAEAWFQKAVQYYEGPEAKFFYALVLMSNNKYPEAERWFRNYSLVATKPKDASNARNLADYAKRLHEHGISYKPFEIFKAPFNTPELDFSPIFHSDTLLVFASNRKFKEKKLNVKDEWTNENYIDLYKVRLYENFNYGEPTLLGKELKSKYHESSAVFTASNDTMYFTRSDYLEEEGRGYDDKRNTRLKIFMVMKAAGKWGKVNEMPFNSNEFSTCHPALSADGNTMVFASDRPGGYGLMDLYVTHRALDGKWSEPENLGPQINTTGNEIFPYLHSDGSIYFSSDGQAGLGGLDIFMAPSKEKLWGYPVNLGAPLNSSRDDFGIVSNGSFTDGYFSSNREGKDDIYRFQKGGKVMLEGVVVICNDGRSIDAAQVEVFDASGLPITGMTTSFDGYFSFEVLPGKKYLVKASKQGFGPCQECPDEKWVTIPEQIADQFVRVELPICSDNDDLTASKNRLQTGAGKGRGICGLVMNVAYQRPMPQTKVIVTNLCTGEEMTLTTDKDGNFFASIEEGCDYIAQGFKHNFTGRMVGIVTSENMEDCIPVEVPLSFDANLLPPELNGKVPLLAGTVFELYNIYFDLDKYYIRPDAVGDLQALYDLLIKYPEMRGELSAHTDSRASLEYNITLAENRAKSARQWLLQRGISPDRLTWKGYGETRLKNECADGVDCTEKQHQRNRRVEFKVTYFNGTVESKEYAYFVK